MAAKRENVFADEAVEENHKDGRIEEAEGCGVLGGGHVERGHAVREAPTNVV